MAKFFFLSLLAGAALFVVIAGWAGLIELPWETGEASKTASTGAEKVEANLGGELWQPESFPPLDPAVGRPRTDPIILRGFTSIKDKQDVPANVGGQILYIGEGVPDGVVEVAGPAAFLAEPYAYNVMHVGDQPVYKFYRRLNPNNPVYSDEVIGMIDCAKALATLMEKQGKIDQAINDEKSAKAAADEASSRYVRDKSAYDKGGLSPAELSASAAAKEKFYYDHLAKGDAVKLARTDLVQAKIFYAQHQIRCKVPFERCVIQAIVRQRGDSVKEQEKVMEVQSLEHLQAEALVEGWYLDRIKPNMTATIEPTQETDPFIFRGVHRGEVTAVAVTNDEGSPRIVSAGTDRLVSVRDPFAGGLPISLRHDDAVRALACAPVGARHNYALTGAGGKVYVWDVSRAALEASAGRVQPVKVIPASESAQITALAFSPDGTYFASGADDGSIVLWRTDNFTRVYPFDAEHGVDQPHTDPITSLHFTPQCRLVSAARDKTVRVWRLKENGAALDGEPISDRGGTVSQLGVRADGKWLLFDQGRSLQLVSLERQGVTVNTLQNPAGSAPFESLAIFSPKGSLLLTAGLAEGRLQLWKAPTETERGFELRQFVTKEKFPATCAAFAPRPAEQGKRSFAVSGNTAGDVYLWPLPTPDEVAHHRIRNVQVRLLSSSIDPNTHQARIAVDLDNPVSPQYPDGRLRPGRAVTVVIGEE